MGQNSSPTKIFEYFEYWKWYKSTTNQPQINPYRCVAHRKKHDLWLIESLLASQRWGWTSHLLAAFDPDGPCWRTHVLWWSWSGMTILSHSDSYQSTLWILPLCHQVRAKTVSWFGSLAKTRLARLDVCRSLFSMLCITCSGEQIQPVEKVWRGMFWRLDPFYCALTWNFIQL